MKVTDETLKNLCNKVFVMQNVSYNLLKKRYLETSTGFRCNYLNSAKKAEKILTGIARQKLKQNYQRLIILPKKDDRLFYLAENLIYTNQTGKSGII